MKAELRFSNCWDDIEIEFIKNTELEFVPFKGMQFMFEPDPFELFVDIVMWPDNKSLLVVGFDYPHHDNKEDFIEAVKAILNQNEWEYRANKKGTEIIDMISKEGTKSGGDKSVKCKAKRVKLIRLF